MGFDERARLLREAVRAIASRCPRMIAERYWAGVLLKTEDDTR
jgi:hypothetical protein